MREDAKDIFDASHFSLFLLLPLLYSQQRLSGFLCVFAGSKTKDAFYWKYNSSPLSSLFFAKPFSLCRVSFFRLSSLRDFSSQFQKLFSLGRRVTSKKSLSFPIIFFSTENRLYRTFYAWPSRSREKKELFSSLIPCCSLINS